MSNAKVGNAKTLVIGGINVDITGRSTDEVVLGTSNPGTISVSPGGAGRNIAEGLARLGEPVALVGSVGGDELAKSVVRRTAQAGVDVGAVSTSEADTGTGTNTNTYLSVVDSSGAMRVAVSDMAGAERTDQTVVARAFARFSGIRLIVVDTNLSAETIAFVLEHAKAAGATSVVQAVSVPKVGRLVELEGSCDWAIMNRDEYAAFISSCTEEQAKARAGHYIVTRGAEGVDHIVSASGETRRYEALPAEIVDENGAGDAFTAGFCAGLARGLESAPAIRMGAAAASLTLGHVGTVPEALSNDQVELLLNGSNT